MHALDSLLGCYNSPPSQGYYIFLGILAAIRAHKKYVKRISVNAWDSEFTYTQFLQFGIEEKMLPE